MDLKSTEGQQWEPPLTRKSQEVHSSIWHSLGNRWRPSEFQQLPEPSPPLIAGIKLHTVGLPYKAGEMAGLGEDHEFTVFEQKARDQLWCS